MAETAELLLVVVVVGKDCFRQRGKGSELCSGIGEEEI